MAVRNTKITKRADNVHCFCFHYYQSNMSAASPPGSVAIRFFACKKSTFSFCYLARMEKNGYINNDCDEKKEDL